MIYTKKQRALMAKWQTNSLKRFNILEGSVSSGKTWISLVLWAFWVKTMPQDALYMMCAKSLTTLKRNCLMLLQELIGESNFSFSTNTKEGQLFGRKILLEGANDIRSESKIRGLTLQGAYCDELTQFPQDFFVMLTSRLRLPGAKLFGTTNPDAPSHWLKVNYIDRQEELDLLDVKFTLDDNTTLPDDYVRNIKKEYTGVFYERFILGLWTLAEGIIYPMYKDAIVDILPHDEKGKTRPIQEFMVSIDYGTMNAFAALLWAHVDDVWYVVKEYYYSGRSKGLTKTDQEYADDLKEWIKEAWEIQGSNPVVTTLGGSQVRKIKTIIDPSAASFIALLGKSEWARVLPADNDVINGIMETARALQSGKVRILSRCRNLINELGGYVWDDKCIDDRPKKENDHACDALRYFVKSTKIAVARREK